MLIPVLQSFGSAKDQQGSTKFTGLSTSADEVKTQFYQGSSSAEHPDSTSNLVCQVQQKIKSSEQVLRALLLHKETQDITQYSMLF